MSNNSGPKLYVRPTLQITEEPKCLVRYRREFLNTGLIQGEDNVLTAVRINDYSGPAIIVVSCVTKSSPHKVHPHRLFGSGTRHGILVSKLTMYPKFRFRFGVGIQRTRRHEVAKELLNREQTHIYELDVFNAQLQIDPFEQGYGHAREIMKEDLDVVRLAVQAFIRNDRGRWEELAPVVSKPIFAKTPISAAPRIRWVSVSSGVIAGGETVVVELDQVAKKDTEVIFFESYKAKKLKWMSRAKILLRGHTVFAFETPFYDRGSEKNVCAFFVVRRRSDNLCSRPCSFLYTPRRRMPQIDKEGSPQETQLRQSSSNNCVSPVTVKEEVVDQMCRDNLFLAFGNLSMDSTSPNSENISRKRRRIV